MEYNTFACGSIIQNKIEEHKSGKKAGVYSICSTNRSVLLAAMQMLRNLPEPLLIESTCNQVNQYGGYTGMTPCDFSLYVKSLADESDFPVERIILGGDHLGPNPWKNETHAEAMKKAEQLIFDCVTAGYQKIHLDTSMSCRDDSELTKEEIAERATRLCFQSEMKTSNRLPVYVIGTEVPIPGGLTAGHDEKAHISNVQDVEETISIFRKTFMKYGLQRAWDRTIAIVVSPGVEFGDREIFQYSRFQNRALRDFIETIPTLVYEAHSTDYQPPSLLRQMVEDHFAILKVGPALTFAYREALFNLAAIEKEIPNIDQNLRSNLIEVLLHTMHAQPTHWNEHYQGTPQEIDFSLKYSFNDRARYYWGQSSIKSAVEKLIGNLQNTPIPLALISQYFSVFFRKVQEGSIQPVSKDLIQASIMRVLENYQFACHI